MGKFSSIFKGAGKTAGKARSKAVRKRAGRMARRRIGKDFARRLLKGFNASDVYDEQQEKSLRNFRRTLASGALKGKVQVDEPPLDTPSTETNISNPDISALNGQLKKLLKTASAMGLVDKETQALALKQIKDANRAAKEQQLETPVEPQAVPEPQEGSGNAISPLADKMQELIKAFEDLIDTVEDKSGDNQPKSFMDRLADGFGFGNARKEYKATPAKVREGFKAETTKSGKTVYRDASGRYTTPEKALKRGYAKNQIVKEAKAARAARAGVQQSSILSRAGQGIKNILSPVTGAASKAAAPVAAAISKTAAVGGMASSATSKIAKGIKTGVGAGKGLAVKGAELTGQALKTAIIKVAGPKIGKALATTGIKSIPILGTIAGLGFAASRLMDGDFVGAGLDAVSGLAGPVTAIPAMVASLARDVYSGVFGVQPETDPQFGERMTIVKSTVQGLVESQLGKKVQTKDKAAPGAAQEKKVPPPQAVKQTSSAPSSQPPPNPPPTPAPSDAAKPIDESSGSSSGSAAGSTSLPPAPAPKPQPGGSSSGGGTTAPPASSSESGSNAAPTPQTAQGPASAITLPPATTTGSQISAATEAADKAGAPRPKVGIATVAVKPATKPTTKTGARGMGNVPEPTYMSMGAIARQLYFSASI